MNTENIIEKILDGNLVAAKKETEGLLYVKVSESIDFITDDIIDVVYGISEGKKKKKSAEDEITFAPSTEMEDDGEGMDPVDDEDSDIDNDGDSDESDDYLKNRRKVRKKKIQKDDSEIEEVDEWVGPALKVAGAVAKPVGKALLGLAKTKKGKEVIAHVGTRAVQKGVEKIKNRNQVPPNTPDVQTEGMVGDGRREFVYGMKVSRYEKLSDKLKAKVKQQWYNQQAEEERIAGGK